ncbi:ArsR/SmtB family transcription factor [Effusibacillus consociatus]|uniref:ArsR/SmtB family transcription factor n=1 Tax=Effusibacillus consociatus TaxID=1117041 RepID=A0ABV9Q7G9_9BACL
MTNTKNEVQINLSQSSGEDTCGVFVYDPEKVQRQQQVVDRVVGLAPLFKVLSDETRLKVIYALSQEDELCVCDVATIIGSSNATASHHLRLLRNMGLAKYRREGKMTFYSLQSPHVRHLIQEALTISKGVNDRG